MCGSLLDASSNNVRFNDREIPMPLFSTKRVPTQLGKTDPSYRLLRRGLSVFDLEALTLAGRGAYLYSCRRLKNGNSESMGTLD
jgi:hypothetical protein